MDGYYNTDRVRNTLRCKTRERIGVGIGVSDWQHVYLAIQRKYTTDRQVRWILDRLGDDRNGGQKSGDWQRIFSASKMARAMQSIRSIDVQTQLREMFNDVTAQFCGVQQAALQAIVEEGKRQVLVIMQTSGRKSLMFMLLAQGSPRGTTIVVVLTTSLQQDLKKQCSKCFIKSAVWDSTRAPPFGAQIVIVIAELAVTKSFARFINIKHTWG